VKATKGKLPLAVSLVAAAVVSSSLIPIYMQFLHLPKDVPAGVVSFVITFAFAYAIISAPTLILSVGVLGSLVIVVLGVIVSFLPLEAQTTTVGDSRLFPMLAPLIGRLRDMLPVLQGRT
jgi:hypothetical protein